jgi:uncharacterized membrane protein (UPF0182 family)
MMASNDPPPPRAPRQGRRWPAITAIALVGGFILLRAFAGYYTDFLWYSEAGYGEVWSTRFVTSIALFGAAAIVAVIVLWGNVVLAGRFSPGIIAFDPEGAGPERLGGWLQPRIRRLFAILAGAFAVLNGLAATVWTPDVLFFINRESFGVSDPQFDVDVGFYIFTLPFVQDVLSWLFQILVLATLLSIAVHYVNGGIRVVAGEVPSVEPGARAHLSILLAGMALVRAVNYVLDQYGLLLDNRGDEFVFGAGATDVDIRIPALRLLALVAAATAVALIINIWRRGWTLPVVSLGLWVVIGVVVGAVVPSLYQRLAIEPNEFNREEQYIQRQMEFTRQAFGIDEVETQPFSGTPELDASDIAANRATVDNIRVWDPPVLASTYDQQQAIRPYYQLADVDVDRYELDGELTQVMLTSREVDVAGLTNRTWVIDHLTYTHGFGGIVSRAADVVNGRPNYLVSDVPPVSEYPELEVSEEGNRIYFGETYGIGSFVVAGSSTPEVDFPLTSEQTEFTSYDGDGGVGIGSLWRRLLFAVRYSDFNLLISPEVGEDARILVKRNVQERVADIAPFFSQDSDPYLVVLDERLTWVVDLYSISDSYPYSDDAQVGRLPIALPGRNHLPNQFNYIRNAAKATVDAQSGETKVYVIDPEDPLARSQLRIFPDSYLSAADLPEGLAEHFRYPEDLFRVQSDMWAEYHVAVDQPGQFYSSEDVWEISNDPADFNAAGITRQALRSTATRKMVPYYLLMTLPGEGDLSFVILQPFNPSGRPNMQSFLIAESDDYPNSYGRLVDYRLNRQTQVAGPSQVKANIDADSAVSQQLTLWNQQGSEVITGNILVIPIEESFVYLQSLYLQSESEQFPELERVVVVYDEEIVMAETFEDGLAEIFGEGTGIGSGDGGETDGETGGGDDGDGGEPDVPVGADELVAAIEAAYRDADAALAAGDLGEYQAKVDEARDLTDQLIELIASSG